MSKEKNLPILSGIFCSSVIISNILAFKTWGLLGITLPTAVIMFPIVYIVNDILAEIYDFKTTSKIILTGFFMNLVAVIAYNIAILLPCSEFFTGQEAFSLVLSNSFRVLVASFTAYIVGSYTNLYVMNRLKVGKTSKFLFFRCFISTVLGEGIDAIIFLVIAFLGVLPFNALLQMIVFQASFKILYEVIFYPVTKRMIKLLKEKTE